MDILKGLMYICTTFLYGDTQLFDGIYGHNKSRGVGRGAGGQARHTSPLSIMGGAYPHTFVAIK